MMESPPLHEAARGGWKLKYIIESNKITDLNIINAQGYTAFEVAMMYRNFDGAYELLKMGAMPLDYRNKLILRPIYAAMESGDGATIQQLIRDKKVEIAELNLLTRTGKSLKTVKEAAEILKTKISDFNDMSIKDILEFCITKKEIELQKSGTETILKYICAKKDGDLLKQMLQNKETTESINKEELIQSAIKQNFREGLEILLDFGIKKLNNLSPVLEYIFSNKDEGLLLKILQDKGFELDIQKDELIFLAIKHDFNKGLDILLQLPNVSLSQRNSEKLTPLTYALSLEKPEMVKQILNDKRIDEPLITDAIDWFKNQVYFINIKRKSACLLLLILPAIKYGKQEAIKQILEGEHTEIEIFSNTLEELEKIKLDDIKVKEEIVNILKSSKEARNKNKHETALHENAREAAGYSIGYIYENNPGIDLNAVNKYGYTAYELAMMRKSYYKAYGLLALGAVPSDYTKKWSTRPFYKALENEDSDAIQRLLETKTVDKAELGLKTASGKTLLGIKKDISKILDIKLTQEIGDWSNVERIGAIAEAQKNREEGLVKSNESTIWEYIFNEKMKDKNAGEVFKKLIQVNEVDVNTAGPNNEGLIYPVIMHNFEDGLDALLNLPKGRIDFSKKHKNLGMTPLMYAIHAEKTGMVEKILNSRVMDKQSIDSTIIWLKDYAIKEPLKQTYTQLLNDYLKQITEVKAKVEVRQLTPLMQAIESGQPEAVKRLLSDARIESKTISETFDWIETGDFRGDVKLKNEFLKILREAEKKRIQAKIPPQVTELIKTFHGELATDLNIPMDPRLFAHIHNDYKILGSTLQGQVFSRTIRYAAECLALHKPTQLGGKQAKDQKERSEPKAREESNKTAIEGVIKQFQIFHELDQTIQDLLITGIPAEILKKGIKEASENKVINVQEEPENQEKKQRQALTQAVVRTITGKLVENKKVLIPGGWTKHAIVYGLELDPSGTIEFTLYNSGAGISYHDRKTAKGKIKYSPLLKFKIKNLQVLELFLDHIIPAKYPKLQPWDQKPFDQESFYKKLMEVSAFPGVEAIPIPDKTPYVGGQRSRTCTWKSLMVVLKTLLPKDAYLETKLKLKLQSLIDFYLSELAKGNLGDTTTQDELRDALSNFGRFLEKVIEQDQEKLKTFAPIFAFCEHVKLELNKAKSQTFNEHLPASVPEMIHFEGASIESAPRENVVEDWGGKAGDLKVGYYGYDPNKPLVTLVDPLTDIRNFKTLLVKLEKNENLPRYSQQLIEQFLFQIPLSNEYAAAIKNQADAYEYQKELFELQNLYASSIQRDTSQLPFASRTIASAHFLVLQAMVGKRYFANEKYGDFTANVEKNKNALIEMVKSPEFYIGDPKSEKRLAEILSYIEKIYKSSADEKAASESRREVNLEKIAIVNNMDELKGKNKRLKAHLDNEFYSNKTFHYKDRMTDITDRAAFDLYTAASNNDLFKDTLTPEIQRDCRCYESFRVFLSNNINLMGGNYSNMIEPSPSHQPFVRLENKLVETNPGYFHTHIAVKKGDVAPGYQRLAQLHITSEKLSQKARIESAHKQLQVSDCYSGVMNKTQNDVQVKPQIFLGEQSLNSHLDHFRHLMNTRTETDKTRVSYTLEALLSHMDKLRDPNYQTLFTINLFNLGTQGSPGKTILAQEITQNPDITYNILEFIQRGMAIYREGQHITGTLAFFLKINHYLINQISALPMDNNIKMDLLTKAKKVDDQIDELLKINDPESRKFTNEQHELEAIATQRKLYIALLQRIERSLEGNVKEVTEKNLREYVKAKLYLSANDFTPAGLEDRLDPVSEETEKNVSVRIAPLLKSHLDTMDDTKRLDFIKSTLPKSILSEFQKLKAISTKRKMLYEFPIVRLTTDSGEIVDLNILDGKLSQGTWVAKKLPAWVHGGLKYEGIFKGEMPTSGFVSYNEKFAEFTKNGQDYRFGYPQGFGGPAGSRLYKKIIINGKEEWFMHRKRQEILNNPEQFKDLLKLWVSKNYNIWTSVTHPEMTVVSDVETGISQYISEKGKFYKVGKDIDDRNHQVIQLNNNKTPFDFLKLFENPEFIEVFRKEKYLKADKDRKDDKEKMESDLVIRIPRYNVEFNTESAGGHNTLIWKDDPRYCIDLSKKPLPIKNFTNQIRLTETDPKKDPKSKLDDLILIPVLPYVTTQKYSFDLDRNGLYLADIGKEPTIFSGKRPSGLFDPSALNLHGCARYVKCTVTKDNDIQCASAEDYLYLAYLSIARHDNEMAFKMLDKFNKKGGFTGSKLEAQVVTWLLQDIPYQLKNKNLLKQEPEIANAQSDSIIATPELVAFRAQVLSKLIQYKDFQHEFKLKVKNDLKENEEQLTINENQNITNFLSNKNLPEIALKVLNAYQETQNNIPRAMRLNLIDHHLLYSKISIDFIPEQLKDSQKQIEQAYRKIERQSKNQAADVIPIARAQRFKDRMEFKEVSVRLFGGSTGSGGSAGGAVDMSKKIEINLVHEICTSKKIFDVRKQLKDRFSQKDFFDRYRSIAKAALSPQDSPLIAEIAMYKIRDFLNTKALLKREDPEKFLENPPENLDANETEFFLALALYIMAKASVEEQATFKEMLNEEYFVTKLIRAVSITSNTAPFKLKLPIPVRTAIVPKKPGIIVPLQFAQIEPAKPLVVREPFKMDVPTVASLLEKQGLALDIKLSPRSKEEDDKLNIESLDIKDYEEGRRQNREIRKLDDVFLEKISKDNNIAPLLGEVVNLKTLSEKNKSELETQLLTIAKTLPPEATRALFVKMGIMGERAPELTAQNILSIFLPLFLKGNMNYYKEQTHLKEKDANETIEAIYALTMQYLLMATQWQHYKRIEDAICDMQVADKGSDDYKKNAAKLRETLYATRRYSYLKHPNLLVFEYLENILIRPEQEKMLSTLLEDQQENFPNKIIQLIMGGGKSKVLLPIAAFKKAKGNNLAIVVVPPALVETNFRDLAETSSTKFGQHPYRFTFTRTTDCNVENLDKLKTALERVKYNKDYVITTSVDVQSVELKWLELLGKGGSKEQIEKLEEILDLFKKDGDVLIDEVDSELDAKKELNFPVGAEERLDEAAINPIIDFYYGIQPITFNLQGERYTIKDVLERRIPTLSEPEWKKLFQDEIAVAILKYFTDKNGSLLNRVFTRYPNKKQQAYNYIQNKEGSSADWMNGLNLTDAEIEEIHLYKGQLSQLLVLSLNQVPNVNYGYSKRLEGLDIKQRLEKEVAIPYEGNNAPAEKSQFASPFETANYTIQLNLINGISLTVLSHYINHFKNEAMREKLNNPRLYQTVSDTPSGKKFASMTGLSANDYNLYTLDPSNPKTLQDIHSKIAKNPEVVRYCLSHFILTQIKTNDVLLRHNAQNHTSLYRSVQGCSGTILSPFAFDRRMTFDKEPALGTDGKTIDYLLSKKTAVHDDVKGKTAFERLSSLLVKDDKFRAIIDVGSEFRGIENLDVAKKIANTFKAKQAQEAHVKGKQEIKYVLFFNKRNKLCALDVSKPEDPPILIGASDQDSIRARLKQCEPENYFTYYDERRITGTDIKQMPNAKALVTVSSRTMRKELLQGVMRMRDLAQTHSVEIVIPPELKKAEPAIKKWDIQTVLELTGRNQVARVTQNNFKVALQKIRNVIREDLLERLKREKDPAIKKAMFTAFDPVIHHLEVNTFHESFKGIEIEDDTNKILQKELQDNLKLWGQCLTNQVVTRSLLKAKKTAKDLKQEKEPEGVKGKPFVSLETIQTKGKELAAVLEKIVVEATQEGICNKREKKQKDNQNTQVEVLTEARSEVQMDVKKTAQKESQQENQLQKIVFNLPIGVSPSQSKIPPLFYTFNHVAEQQAKSDGRLKLPCPFSEDLYVSTNFYETIETPNKEPSLLNGYKKPITHIMFLQNPKTGELKSMLLSPLDAAFYRGKTSLKPHIEGKGVGAPLNLTETNEGAWQAWIVTPKGIPYSGRPPAAINKLYPSMLEQIRYYNGDTDTLVSHFHETVWLTEQQTEKLSFYERVIQNYHPDKSEAYPFLKQKLQEHIFVSKFKDHLVARSNSELKISDEYLRSIVNAKENLNQQDKTGRTLLLWAIDLKAVDVAELLLDQLTVEVNKPDMNGVTALHLAVKMQDLKLVESLLKRGANALAQDSSGCRPLDLIDTQHFADPKREGIRKMLLEEMNPELTVKMSDGGKGFMPGFGGLKTSPDKKTADQHRPPATTPTSGKF